MKLAGFRCSMVLLAVCATVHAADAGTPLTLNDAIDYALKHHPLLTRTAADRDVFTHQLGQAEAAFRPSVQARGSLRDDLQDPLDVTSATPVGWSNVIGYDASLTVNKLITDSGRTAAQLAGIRASERQTRGQLSVDRLDIEQSVARAYLQVLLGEDLLAVSTGAIALVEQQRDRSTALFKATLRPEIDVLSAETQLTQAQLAKMRDENAVAAAKVALSNAMGTRSSEVIAAVAPVEIAPLADEKQDATTLADTALSQRPELAALRDGIAALQASVRIARLRRSPTVTASAGARANANVSMYPWLGARQWVPGADAFVSVAVTWDLYLGRADTFEIRETETRVRSGQAELERVRQSIDLAVSRAKLAVDIARETLRVATAYRVQAERQLALAKSRYESQVGNFVELNDARTQVVSAQRQEVQARYDLALARVTLARELGRRPGELARAIASDSTGAAP